jgi:mRNA-degrading endonuclease RelE of RelBE toxin-antitoxin system
MKTIEWNNKAFKQMKKIPKQYHDIIFKSVDSLENFPKCQHLDIKPLQKHKYNFRMRVGRYRVLFDDKESIQVIAIQEVKKRDNRTY